MSVKNIPQCSVNANVLSALGDNPNVDDNLNSTQLKAKFDEAPSGIVDYLNNQLRPNAQGKITSSGILKGDGLGGVSTAEANTDYQTPLKAGTDYQTPLKAGKDYQTPLADDKTRKITVSTSQPSGGADGDLWIVVS